MKDLALVSAENEELARHREDVICLDEECVLAGKKLVFDHGTRILLLSCGVLWCS